MKIKIFGRDIYEGKITLKETNEYQTELLVEIIDFKKNTKPRSGEKKQEKRNVLQNLYNLFEGRERVLNAFDSKILLTKSKSNSESLLNEIRQIVYSLYHSKQITKKVYINIIKFINVRR